MSKPTITMADLQGEGERILHHGTVLNGDLLNQIYMTDSNIGRELMWVAQKGYVDDWCITCHWKDNGLAYATTNGDKVTFNINIRVLVDVSDEVLKHYRR